MSKGSKVQDLVEALHTSVTASDQQLLEKLEGLARRG